MFSFCALFAFGNYNFHLATNNNIIDYKVKENTYAVVVVQEQGMSRSEVKQIALKRAAEITQKHHFRFFVIETKEDVQATQSSKSKSLVPGNRYYEVIQSDNFGRDRFENSGDAQIHTYPAYRLIFQCYSDKPSRKAIDSCTLVDCKK